MYLARASVPRDFDSSLDQSQPPCPHPHPKRDGRSLSPSSSFLADAPQHEDPMERPRHVLVYDPVLDGPGLFKFCGHMWVVETILRKAAIQEL